MTVKEFVRSMQEYGEITAIDVKEAAYNMEQWKEEGIETPGYMTAERLAEEWNMQLKDLETERRRMRKSVARSLLYYDRDLDYDKVLDVLENMDVFGDWSLWELTHRPVDMEELDYCVHEVLEEIEK